MREKGRREKGKRFTWEDGVGEYDLRVEQFILNERRSIGSNSVHFVIFERKVWKSVNSTTRFDDGALRA